MTVGGSGGDICQATRIPTNGGTKVFTSFFGDFFGCCVFHDEGMRVINMNSGGFKINNYK